jgi:hypothetical protein
MNSDMYSLSREANRLRRELLTDPANQNWAELRTIEDKLAAAKAASASEPAAVILNNKTQPVFLGPETTGLEAEVLLRMAQVPTSIAHLLDPAENPLITVKLRHVGPPAASPQESIKRVRVTSFVEGYSARAVETVELRRGANNATLVSQLPTFFPAELEGVNELTRATLNVAVEHLDRKEQELQTTRNIWLLPRTTAVLEMKDPASGKWKDLSRYLAAYVTPNAPAVMAFLAEAKKQLPPGRAFSGYQPPKEAVGAQVEALFNALKDKGTAYVNSVIAFADQDYVTTQRVRLPRESLQDTSANCIDGVVLFASLLEAVSLNPSIVQVSGHAFLGWESWPGGGWKYLETTMIATGSFADACSHGDGLAQQFAGVMTEVRVTEARSKYRITPMA